MNAEAPIATPIPPRFYYLNDTNEPVGPFGLGELRRMLGANISETTLIAQEGASNWLPLKTYLPEDAVPSISMPETASVGARRILKAWPWAIAASSIELAYILAVAVFGTEGILGEFGAMPAILALVSLGLLLQLHSECWSALPGEFRWTTPAQASWFMLIPVYCWYWAFRSWPKLSEGYEQWQLATLGHVRIFSTRMAYGFSASWLIYLLIPGLAASDASSIGGIVAILCMMGLVVGRYVLFLLYYRLIAKTLSVLPAAG